MKKQNNFLSLLIGVFVILASSCESVLFIELEESDKLIVMNGALSNDSTVMVQVSRTRHILDNATIVPLENAKVSLYRGSTMLEQLDHKGGGFFRATSYHPAVGEELSIEVEQAGYPPVSASCLVPETVAIEAVDTATMIQVFSEYNYSYTQEFFQIDVTLNDPPGVENYYLLNLEVDKSYTSWRDTSYQFIDSLFHNGEWHYFVADTAFVLSDTFRYKELAHVGSPDLIVEAITSQGILFSDQLIDGKEYSIRANTNLQSVRSADSAVVDIRLNSISESYYKYLRTRQKHYETKEDPFAVPVIVYTNIEGGTGFLGGYSSDVHTITTFVPEFGEEYWYQDYYKK